MLETFGAAVKLLLYLAAFNSAGIALAAISLRELLERVARFGRDVVAWSAAVVLFASVLHVVVLVLRLDGDFSGPTLFAILTTPVGLAAGLQLIGAVLLVTFELTTRTGFITGLAGAVAVLASFGVNGHSSAASVAAGVVAFVHVSAAAWWHGALVLLAAACRQLSRGKLAALVKVFSQYAAAVVVWLLACGVALIGVLVDFSQPGWLTPYVQTLALKIVFVGCALGIATYNKFRLTPRLDDKSGDAARALHRSIAVELLILFSVLMTTAWLTTFYSPHH